MQFVLEFILALVIFIIIHEVGHFIVCRLLKVEVEEFGLGLPVFGPGIKLFEAGGTKFTFYWFLLGGFVRPKGENDPTVPGGLAASSPWVRIAVFIAGPVMNLLAGVLLFAFLIARFGNPVAIDDQVQIYAVVAESPAAQAGLKSCDVIEKVNGTPITSTDQLTPLIRSLAGQEVLLTYRRNNVSSETTLVPRANPPEGQGPTGIQIGAPYEFRPAPGLQVIPMSLMAVYNYANQLVSLPGRMLQGQASAEEGRLVGPKGMIDIYSEVRQGNTPGCTPQLMTVLSFFASITTSLGLLNLLPIPALDGGRIVLALPEILLRRRVPAKYENLLIGISFALLILLMLYVFLQDFINPVTIR